MAMNERDKLAEQHFGLVHAICKRFSGKGIEYDELFAAGCLGLSKALTNFDTERGLQFSTYAFPSDHLQQTGAELTVSQLADKLGVSVDKIVEATASTKPVISLTADYDDEGNPQIDVPTADIQVEISERLSLRQAIEALDDLDRKIIQLRYYQSKTQTQTAAVLHMTQVQISRREKKILAQIREQLAS